MSDEQRAPELISTGIQTMVKTADRLGLVWGLRPATVITVTADSTFVLATYDGDTVPISMINLLGSLVHGARVMAMFVPPSGNYIIGYTNPSFGTDSHFDSTLVTTTSTAYVLSATVVGFSFIGPPSGHVEISWRAQLVNNTAGGNAFCAPEIREGSVVGSGNVVQAAADSISVIVTGTNIMSFGSTTNDFPTLTPGAIYNVALLQRSSSGANTASVNRREVILRAIH